ncbi:predicted acyltransferases [Acetobacter aceti NRIC 0242]|nr:predicted acyltransferases [Acetobacter aceti NRIC 0242]
MYYGIPGALFIYGLVGLERSHNLTLPRIFSALGDISYSLYLWHMPVGGFFLYLSVKCPTYSNTDASIKIICETATSIFISHFSYRYIEKPFNYIGHKLSRLL